MHHYVHFDPVKVVTGDDSGLSQKLDTIIHQQQQLLKQGEKLMAGQERLDLSFEDLKNKTDVMAAGVQALKDEDATEDAAFQARIDDLTAQLAAGEAIRVEQLEALANSAAERVEARAAALQPIIDALQVAGTDPANPLPPVEPPADSGLVAGDPGDGGVI